MESIIDVALLHKDRNMIPIYLDDDVVKAYYAVAAIVFPEDPDVIHPRAWVREKIEELVKRETTTLRKQLDEELGNIVPGTEE